MAWPSILAWSLLGAALVSWPAPATSSSRDRLPGAPAEGAPRIPRPQLPPIPELPAAPLPDRALVPVVPFVHTPLLGDPCRDESLREPSVLREPGGPKRYFSVDGYIGKRMIVTRDVAGVTRRHCISVAWPPGDTNTAGKPCRVAKDIDPSWFRAIQNTLARIPWSHVELLRRFVIDDRPTAHGVAPYDRKSPDDARDGHTIWLSSHLFRDPNHSLRGNYGTYWAYHVNVDGVAFDGKKPDHQLFSPVLLHEIGHTVMYNLVNPESDPVSTPECARTCADTPEGCAALSPDRRERGCISTYCRPFDYPGSTENWAELYRFHYQSSTTRALLARAEASCLGELARIDTDTNGGDSLPAPWERGLPDIARFRPSRWKSCNGRPCKPW